LLTAIAGSKPACGTAVCFCEYYVLSGRSSWRADQSAAGFLLMLVRACVCVSLRASSDTITLYIYYV
jgi:hypothetical protein